MYSRNYYNGNDPGSGDGRNDDEGLPTQQPQSSHTGQEEEHPDRHRRQQQQQQQQQQHPSSSRRSSGGESSSSSMQLNPSYHPHPSVGAASSAAAGTDYSGSRLSWDPRQRTEGQHHAMHEYVDPQVLQQQQQQSYHHQAYGYYGSYGSPPSADLSGHENSYMAYQQQQQQQRSSYDSFSSYYGSATSANYYSTAGSEPNSLFGGEQGQPLPPPMERDAPSEDLRQDRNHALPHPPIDQQRMEWPSSYGQGQNLPYPPGYPPYPPQMGVDPQQHQHQPPYYPYMYPHPSYVQGSMMSSGYFDPQYQAAASASPGAAYSQYPYHPGMMTGYMSPQHHHPHPQQQQQQQQHRPYPEQGHSVPLSALAELEESNSEKQLPKKKSKPSRKFSRRSTPGKPKRPLSAYNLFFQAERAKLVDAAGGDSSISKKDRKKKGGKSGVGFAEMAKHISAKWKSIDKELLAQYKHEAELDLDRYRREMQEFHSRQGGDDVGTTSTATAGGEDESVDETGDEDEPIECDEEYDGGEGEDNEADPNLVNLKQDDDDDDDDDDDNNEEEKTKEEDLDRKPPAKPTNKDDAGGETKRAEKKSNNNNDLDQEKEDGDDTKEQDPKPPAKDAEASDVDGGEP